MFKHLIKFMKLSNGLRRTHQQNKEPAEQEDDADRNISVHLDDNVQCLERLFEDSSGVLFRKFTIGKTNSQAMIVNIDGLSDKQLISEGILRSVMEEAGKIGVDGGFTLEQFKQSVIHINDIKEASTMNEVLESILNGDTALLFEGFSAVLLIGTQAYEHRGVEPPQTEVVVRGSREGFTESLGTNIALLRRRIKDTDLKIEMIKLGKRTRTSISIVYLKQLADENLVKEIRRRLQSIQIDAILESGYIEELIEDHPYSIFPTIGNTESPDRLAGKLLEGRVGILVDGTPFVLTAPLLFVEHLQATEDYYSRPYLASLLRLLRFASLHISIFLPALYLAITTFNPSILPFEMLNTISAAHAAVPLTIALEAAIMVIIFDLLREAGVRLPKPVGQTVSIVGALILGQAAIQSGIVSPPIVIIVGLAGIASFVLPPQTDSITVLKLPILLVTSVFGFVGLLWCYFILMVHLVSLRSFGVPYMSPFAPFHWKDFKDVLVRVPWRMMKTRSISISGENSQRQAPSDKHNGNKNNRKDD